MARATSGLDKYLTRNEGGTTQVYLTDALGSVVGLANTDGTVATTYAYDPNGTPTASGATSTNPYTFTGREDDHTGLLYYRDRYYDPQTGRFISQDPSGQAGGTNLYQYALASPTTYTDPSGNNPLIAGCVIGGLLDGGLDWLTQRLSGRKVNWGQVGQSAVTGCLSGMLGEGLGALLEGRLGSKLASCAFPNSFTGDTPVRMADGASKPIKDVEIGDTVIATDPETGKSEPRKVTALIKGEGDKQLVDITYHTDGSAGTKTGTLTATDGHPFWTPQLHQWVEAGDLTAGQWLQTSSGTWVQITAIRHHTQQTSVYNLTIDGLHTYYAGHGQAVLVHNAEPGCGPHLALGLRNIRGGQPGLLDEFARGIGAITYQDPMFKIPIGGVMTEPMVKDMIDLVVSRGGRMTFNLHGVTKVDEMLAGGNSYVATRVTAMELRYICGNEAARAVTTFVNGAAPC
ncbi:RHS repeat-associated core domain-containing protein [Streptomyces sp. NPDC001759]